MRLLRSVVLVVAATFVTAPALAFSGDAGRGEKIYERCIACHSFERDRTGPRHEGLFGRSVGGLPQFPYSPALRAAGARGMVWDETTLDGFLANPTKFLPGTRMGYAGVRDPQERADLIAFLKQAGRAK
jgi:cytochrome c